MAQTILIVDDEARLRDMIRVYLEQEGYRRTKVEPDPKNPVYIETVYGMGYRFAARKAPAK